MKGDQMGTRTAHPSPQELSLSNQTRFRMLSLGVSPRESRMAGERMREVVVSAVVTDAYDGLIRLLGDAQRFGFALRASTLSAEGDGSASVTLTLSVPARLEVQLVAARLA